MEFLLTALDYVLHVNVHLNRLIELYGAWVYLILFLVVFAETGLVVTPFLPGDSLLFAAGALAAMEGSALSLPVLLAVLLAAAILGDAANYAVGARLGPAVLRGRGGRLLNQAHLARAHAFYERYGGKTIVLARFVPIVRTFAPFVAGAGSMAYPRFLAYNALGGALWVGVCVGGGHLFGNIPVVREHFSLVALGIVAFSLLPVAVGWWRRRSGES